MAKNDEFEQPPSKYALCDFLDAMKGITKGLSVTHRASVDKLISTPFSKARAIRVNCQSCMGFENVVNRIRYCSVLKCPLWAVRPYQIKNKEADDAEKI